MTLENPDPDTVDLTNCDREPIHQLGFIQPFGCLFAFSSDWFVVHVSDNVSEFAGRTSESLLGTQATEFMQSEAIHALRTRLQWLQGADAVERLFGIDMFADGRRYDASIHRSGDHIIVEIEPSGTEDRLDVVALVRSMIARLANAGDMAEFLQMAARQLRFLCGFDRVMVYRFLQDGGGEVVAEEKKEDAEAYLGLRYPASDIPRQARELYKRSLIRLIADVGGDEIPIVPETDPQGEMLDLSLSTLRSVSRIHIEYLTNMGVGASMSASILVNGNLWGLFACHHDTPRLISFDRRTAVELFTQMFALELNNRENRALADIDVRAASVHSRLLASMAQEGGVFDRLSARLRDLRSAIACDGIGIWIDGRYAFEGRAVNTEEMQGLVRFLNRAQAGRPYATDHLLGVYPQSEVFSDRVAGVLAIPVSRSPRDYIVFFRSEQVRSVEWAGDPTKPVTVGPNGIRLTPRKSFETWKETVSERSSPWLESDLRIAESIRHTLIEIFLRHAETSEQFRRDSQQKQDLLISELNHRVRNILGLVRGIVTQTESSVRSVEQFTKVLGGRIHALARAHDQLTAENWGPAAFAPLVETELAAYLGPLNSRATVSGPDIMLQPQAFSSCALVVHELVTNSAKYGALSNETGQLDIVWTLLDDGHLEIRWSETGGPPVSPPRRRGFGSTIIERAIPFELGGKAELDFDVAGLNARFVIPAAHVTATGRTAEPAAAPDLVLVKSPEAPAGTILLVEDNMIIAIDTEKVLLDLGFDQVIVASNTAEALELIGEHDFSAALLDVSLGEETSLPVAEELLKRGVPVVFATGYGHELRLPESMEFIPLVAKPFSVKDLAKAFGRAND